MDPTSSLRLGPSEITVIGLLMTAIITGMMGKWVFGSVYREAIDYRDARIESLEAEVTRWQNIALKAIDGTSRAVAVAEQVVKS